MIFKIFEKSVTVSRSINLKHTKEKIWDLISSKRALELFHPYCLKNEVLSWNINKIDKLIYLNGLEYIREFDAWTPYIGYDLYIGKKDGKKSILKWKIEDLGEGCSVCISIKPYKSSRMPNYFYFLAYIFVIKPKLKQYLNSVLAGLRYYLDNQQPVKKNHFGKHPWFS